MADNTSYVKGIIYQFSEISHFPFGFILSFKRITPPMDDRLVDITSWKNYRYELKERQLTIPLQTLPVEVAMFPGDFRTRQEIEEAIRQSDEYDSDDD